MRLVGSRRRLLRRIPGRAFASRVSLLALGGATAVVFFASSDARASCNLIPVAKKQFPSTLGGVESPITSPGKTVTLAVTSCDASAGFEPIAADNDVELRFEPPGAGADTAVTINSATVTVNECTLPGGRCATLSFETPDTSALLAPYGLAGPARITVRDLSTAVVAEIGSLFLPALSCDREPETVFRQFTMLPQANSFADAVSGAVSELRATVDGGGDLLVPFDYWGGGTNSVLAETPGSPVAIFLKGSSEIPAMGAGDTHTIRQVIGAQPSPSSFLRSFTLNGRPLPPLLRVTDDGKIFGSADAVESVLRVARNDGKGGPALYDLSDRLFMSKGPIVITAFSAERHNPIPLNSIRSSGAVVAYARDEDAEGPSGLDLNGDTDAEDFVAQIVDAAAGISTNTGRAVTFASPLLPYAPLGAIEIGRPAITASGNLVAFLESESAQETDHNGDLDFDDSRLRVYRGATDIDASSLPIDAAPVSVIDRQPVSISGSQVFFRETNPFVQAVLDSVDGVTGLDGLRDIAISPNGKHVYTASATDAAITAFARDGASGRLSFVEAETSPVGAATNLTVSPDGKHVYVAHHNDSGVSIYARNDTTGELTYVDQYIDAGNGGLTLIDDIIVSADGANVYTAGSGGVAVFSRNQISGLLTPVQFQSVPGGVPALVASPDGKHVYAGQLTSVLTYDRSAIDGTISAAGSLTGVGGLALSITPDGSSVYAGASDELSACSRNATTGALTLVQTLNSFAASPDFPAGDVPDVNPRGLAVSADGTRVFSAGGYSGSLSVFARNQGNGALTFLEAEIDQLGGVHDLRWPQSVVASADGRFAYVAANAYSAVTVFHDDLRLRAFDADTQSLRPSVPFATVAATAAERAVLLTPESFAGVDLNGDGDTLDDVAQLYDASGATESVTSLGLAATHVAISDQIVALTVPEGNQNFTDLSFDGDTDDDVLVVYDIAKKTFDVTTLQAHAIAVSGRKVVFSEDETGGANADLNGDGDFHDRVLEVYDSEKKKLTNTFQEAEDFSVRGDFVAFRVSEMAQDSYDLDGDGDAFDYVMQTYDLASDTLLSSRQAATVCYLPGCDVLAPYAIDPVRKTISFLEFEDTESSPQGDFNGDGDFDDIVLQVLALRSRVTQTVATTQPNASTQVGPFPASFVEDDVVFHQIHEDEIGVDVNDDGNVDNALVTMVSGDSDGDGMYDDFDTCVEASNPDGIDADADELGDSACDPDPSACPPVPLGSCHATAPGGSTLKIRDNADDAKDSVGWKWSKGEATSLGNIGDPVTGIAHYSLCVYDASAAPQPIFHAAAVGQTVCGKKPCWKATGTKGFGFKDKSGHLTGATLLKLTSGGPGKSKALFKGKGSALVLPALPASAPLTVQLIVNEGTRQDCWEALYSATTKNDGAQLSAKSE